MAICSLLEFLQSTSHVTGAPKRFNLFMLLSSEGSSLAVEKCGKSNSGLFRSVTSAVCCYLSQIGDEHLVFKMLEGAVVDQIVSWLKPSRPDQLKLLLELV